MNCQLWLGSDDGVKVWLNGAVVYSANVARAITPDSDKVNISLKKGWNTLIFKVTQNNMGVGILCPCAKFRRFSDFRPAFRPRADAITDGPWKGEGQ